MQLNVTFNGVSGDTELELDYNASDADIKRIALEIIQSGGIAGMSTDVPADAFSDFVVDRVQGAQGGERIFLRPKVPFGAKAKVDGPEIYSYKISLKTNKGFRNETTFRCTEENALKLRDFLNNLEMLPWEL